MNDFQPLPASFAGKTAAVVGVGISNRPLIDFLLAEGASVIACDRKSRESLGLIADELEAKGVSLRLGDSYLEGLREDFIFRAPGIRFDRPELLAASENGSVVTSEMELFFERCPCRIVGITGSSGKTTTTTLISMILRGAGKEVFLGGNIGRPLLPELHSMNRDSVAVVELSSFQLHTMRRSPDVSVVTNVSPNHLDYHNGMEEYIDAKCGILRYMMPGGRAVLNLSDPITSGMRAVLPDGVTVFGFDPTAPFPGDADAAVTMKKTPSGSEIICIEGDELLPADDIILPGRFNAENYMAASAAVMAFADITGDDREKYSAVIREVAATFGGVPHRLELIPTNDGVRYYNSSIDSSPSRTEATISVFAGERKSGRLIVICGGYDKKIPYEPLAPALCRIADDVILTGATGPKIRAAIDSCEDASEDKMPSLYDRPIFDDAVETACRIAKKGDIVLLSPASASFDAFENFEKRGERFASLVKEITTRSPSGI